MGECSIVQMSRLLVIVVLLASCAAAVNLDTSCSPADKAHTMLSVGLEPVPHEIVLPPELCEQIINTANEEGYSEDPDSIDGQAVLDINVYNHERVLNQAVYSLLQPYLPAMKAALDLRFLGQQFECPVRGERIVKNSLDWVFLRKYEAGHRRDSLLAHHDENLHTINVPLNADYEGGSLFFIPVNSKLGELAESDVNVKKYLKGEKVSNECNSSNYFFPHLPVGIGTIYNKTIWHGVTRMSSGTRYTLSFFYDEPESIRNRDENERPDALFENRLTVDQPLRLYWLRNMNAVTDENGNFLRADQVQLEPRDVLAVSEEFDSEGSGWRSGTVHTETTTIGHVFAAMAEGSTKPLKMWKIVPNVRGHFLEDADLAGHRAEL